jgi:hypothetical protein
LLAGGMGGEAIGLKDEPPRRPLAGWVSLRTDVPVLFLTHSLRHGRLNA